MARHSWVAAVLRRSVRTRQARRGVSLAVEPLEDRRNPTSVSMVQDILAGIGASNPRNLVNVNGTLFFTAADATHGQELWKSDGTAAGTVVVKDIISGSGGSNPDLLAAVNGTVFFSATGGAEGRELWKSDGTEAGTVLVKDINPNPGGSSDPFYMTDVNGTVFFVADDGAHGKELWKSDGTAAGTTMVQDINPGAADSDPSSLTNVNGTLFFSADDGIEPAGHRHELWKSDGTPGGTMMVKDISLAGSYPRYLTAVNGTLFFTANDGTHGDELWKSDGTETGTVMVKDIRPGLYPGSKPRYLTAVNGTLFFTANDGTHGEELWKSDGTEDGTMMVEDIASGADNSLARNLTAVNGTLFFSADDHSAVTPRGLELWRSDGTAAGTVLVKDIDPGTDSSAPRYLTAVNGKVFFAAADGTHGYELWESDGTDAGTVVHDINPGAFGSSLYPLGGVSGTLYFAATDGVHGIELWKATEFSDDFNRADNPSLGTGWVESPGNLAIVNNQLMAVGTTGGTALASGVTLTDARVEAEVSLLTTGNSKAELLLRAQSPTAAYFGSLVGNNGTLTAYIRRGTRTLASAPVVAPLGTGVLRFEAAGSLLKLFWNDTLVATAVDSTYKSGKVGVRGTQFVAFDDFFASSVAPELPLGDSFDRNADSTSLGTQWREQAGDLAVVGNQVSALGTGGNVAIYQWGAAKDVSVQADVTVFSPAESGLTGSAGLVARYTGPADRNYYLGALVGVNGAFTARIYRNLNGTLTQLASASVGSETGLLRFEVIGSSLKLFVNGALAVKTTDTRLAGPGQVGVRGTPRSAFDAFNAQQLFPTLFYDGFNPPGGTAPDLGPAWKALKPAVPPGFSVVGSRASAGGAGTNLAVRDGVKLKDVALEATVTLPGTGVEEAGLGARAKDANNYYYAALERDAGGAYSVAIYKVVGGVKTRLGSHTVTPPPGAGTLRFVVTGNTLTLTFDDGTTTTTVTATSSAFTAAGLAGLRGSQGATFDDFTMA